MWATVVIRCCQYLQAGSFGNYNSQASVSINRRITRWILSSICLLSRSFGNRLKWIISYNISQQETNVSKLTLKLACWPGFSRRSARIFCIGKVWTYLLKEICYEIMDTHPGGNDKDLRMIRCRFTRILNPEHNLSNLILYLFCSISLPWINPS